MDRQRCLAVLRRIDACWLIDLAPPSWGLAIMRAIDMLENDPIAEQRARAIESAARALSDQADPTERVTANEWTAVPGNRLLELRAALQILQIPPAENR